MVYKLDGMYCLIFFIKLVLVYEAKHHQKSSQTLMMLALPYSPLCPGSHAKAGPLLGKMFFHQKNDFNQPMACRAPVRWSKYTTHRIFTKQIVLI